MSRSVRSTRSSKLSPSRSGPWRVLAVAALLALLVGACGGNTGEDKATGGGGGDPTAAALPLIYGVFATPLEEPWDGAIHAALTAAAEDGKIEYKYVDNVKTSDAMERSLRDIATNEKPDAIMGDAFAAEEAVRQVAAEFPDIPFAFGSGGSFLPASPSTMICRRSAVGPVKVRRKYGSPCRNSHRTASSDPAVPIIWNHVPFV